MKKEEILSLRNNLIIITLGIAYGDIGTSPLYTLRSCFVLSNMEVNKANTMGFISLIIYFLILVITVKYMFIILRANNNGEGGIITLLNSVIVYLRGKTLVFFVILGLLGTSFFIGDAVITPAISVLSSVEGLITIYPNIYKHTVAIAICILIILFFIQKYGTNKIGGFFGPIMLLWFIILAIIGFYNISLSPEILEALNPIYMFNFLRNGGFKVFVSLGAVVLALTGAESLYADLGHCGLKPIRKSWFSVVFPALCLNYMGQGALLISNPEAIDNPFFLSFPSYLLIPMVIFSCLVAVIASQAIISGTFSVISQAIHLGYLPKMKIIYTSNEKGQIYIPFVNYALFFLVVLTVFLFGHSDRLAAAYGLSMTATMIVTTIFFYVFATTKLRWNKFLVLLCTMVFLFIDLMLFSSNIMKFFDSAWYPILISIVVFSIFRIWINGVKKLNAKDIASEMPLDALMSRIQKNPPYTVKGRNAVFLVENFDFVPNSLLQNIEHNKVLHEHNVLLNIKITNDPYNYKFNDKISAKKLNDQFFMVVVKYGFKETPDIKKICMMITADGILDLDINKISFFLSDRKIVLSKKNSIFTNSWLSVFYIIYINRGRVAEYYKIPLRKLIELGCKIEL